jgi:RimJ/RimL family protein N-acetyltransferase
MSLWIPAPVTLAACNIRLEPLSSVHFEGLHTAAADERIWTYLPTNGRVPAKLEASLQEALLQKIKGEHYPFVVLHQPSGRVLGSTRFLDIQPLNRKLEIGWTWYIPEVWGTGVNAVCKYLLLQYAFETLHTVRVQIKAGENNLRSRAAISKLGAQFEGILRKERIRENGEIRNTAYYSIIDDEWPAVKAALEARMKEIVL